MPPTRSARTAPGRHSALPWSRPAIAQHPARGPQPGPLVGRLAVLLTARSWGQVPTYPRGQGGPREPQRTAPELPGLCQASSQWPTGGPLAVLLTARSWD